MGPCGQPQAVPRAPLDPGEAERVSPGPRHLFLPLERGLPATQPGGSHEALASQDGWTSRWLLTHGSRPQPGCGDRGRPAHVSRGERGQSGISRGTLLTHGAAQPPLGSPKHRFCCVPWFIRPCPRSPTEGTSSHVNPAGWGSLWGGGQLWRQAPQHLFPLQRVI